ncbi:MULTISPECIES: helix-turn-helix transcriptional regulator [Kribbella]|uniref:ArsR family transcriptional regulator n=1 Tax=Kribbella pratensis TaxID=2512112 RepID=A0ABY2FC97_9ACTN|nr:MULTISPECIES: winged helix-turn-helix domain-containing protein [Kribbella]TDW88231.1 ArsR family transcriptional regulator [Kribbella pratensis]TDW88556.1 ArsR family transcriptional regulator [Kribbella sp. VKM Ac-2566]
MAKKKRLVITDPKAIRALAHPARQRVIDELFNGKVLTATECAELAGLTPSAMSYHLRALEKWGIIQRADESADGRERPWQAPAASLVISSQSTSAGRLASQAMIKTAMDGVLDQFVDMDADDPWDDVSSMSRSRLWLTHDEAKRFNEELIEVVDRYKKGRTITSHPAGAREVTSLIAVVPTGDPPDNS